MISKLNDFVLLIYGLRVWLFLIDLLNSLLRSRDKTKS